MAILIDKTSRVLVQGFTGKQGSFHAQRMIDYGTDVVGGVSPQKAGTFHLERPVFGNVKEAVKKTKADVSVILVPAPFATEALREAAEGGIKLAVVITEGIPVLDLLKTVRFLKKKHPDFRFIGPNGPGIIAPGRCKIGIMDGDIHRRGRVGVVSRSGTLTYEVVWSLTQAGLGQSASVGIGGDPIVGMTFCDLLQLFQDDKETEGIALIGEIGGTDEQRAAEFIKEHVTKPVAAFVAGRTAPPERRMGHAGAIVSGKQATVEAKEAAFRAAGVSVAGSPLGVVKILKKKLGD